MTSVIWLKSSHCTPCRYAKSRHGELSYNRTVPISAECLLSFIHVNIYIYKIIVDRLNSRYIPVSFDPRKIFNFISVSKIIYWCMMLNMILHSYRSIRVNKFKQWSHDLHLFETCDNVPLKPSILTESHILVRRTPLQLEKRLKTVRHLQYLIEPETPDPIFIVRCLLIECNA